MAKGKRQKLQSPEIRKEYLDAVLQLAGAESTSSPKWQDPAFDHQCFWRFLRCHLLTNLAWTWLDGNQPANASAAYMEQVARHRAGRLPRQAHLWSEMQRLDATLQEAGIEYAVLKGFPLSSRLYGDIQSRHQGDIDILVDVEQIPGVIESLTRHGYAMKRGRRRITQQKLRTEHAMDFKSESVSIDVHWRLRTAPAYAIDNNAIWASRRQADVEGRTLPALSDEYQLTLLLLSMVHSLGSASLRLKHATDAYLLASVMDAETDWRSFLERRRADNTLHAVANGLAMLFHLFRVHHRLSVLWNAVEASGAPLYVATYEEAWQIASRSRGAIENQLWFAQVYPGSKLRGAMWLVDREFAHVGRIPVMAYRALRTGCQLTRFFCNRLAAR